MVKVNWTEQSVNDLKNIHDYISIDSKFYAKHYIKGIRRVVSIVQYNPLIGRVVPEINSDTLRELIHGNYRIIYKIINENRIDIISIFHFSRLLNLNN